MSDRMDNCVERHRGLMRAFRDATAHREQLERDLKAAVDVEARASTAVTESRGDLIKSAEGES